MSKMKNYNDDVRFLWTNWRIIMIMWISLEILFSKILSCFYELHTLFVNNIHCYVNVIFFVITVSILISSWLFTCVMKILIYINIFHLIILNEFIDWFSCIFFRWEFLSSDQIMSLFEMLHLFFIYDAIYNVFNFFIDFNTAWSFWFKSLI